MPRWISIHAPVKRATGCFERSGCHAGNFNPRSREGSDLIGFPIWISAIYFNPRSREGSDCSLCLSCFRFQSTLPRRERPEKPKSVIYMREFQSTLPQRERHVFRTESDSRQDISIHAPAKGATGRSRVGAAAPRYFNPRSREGSDHTQRECHTWQPCHFNPRSREGSDVLRVSSVIRVNTISIHAPVKGATQIASGGRWQDVISIHAPVKGATLKYQMEVYITWYFNPRSREGSDHQSVHTWSACTYFNPRSREGSDGADIKRRVFVVISIHAPVKGATPIGTRTICSGIFQSTLP